MNTDTKTKLIALSSQNSEYAFTIRNDYELSYKDKNMKVEIIEEPDGFTILSANGLRYPTEVVSRKQNVYEVFVNGVSYTFSVETPFSLNRKKMLLTSLPLSKNEIIKAPMPGKIIEVMVKDGQKVNPGEPLLILEAMKMQNTIVSHTKGIINKVTISPGVNVGKDDMLIEIEKI